MLAFALCGFCVFSCCSVLFVLKCSAFLAIFVLFFFASFALCNNKWEVASYTLRHEKHGTIFLFGVFSATLPRTWAALETKKKCKIVKFDFGVCRDQKKNCSFVFRVCVVRQFYFIFPFFLCCFAHSVNFLAVRHWFGIGFEFVIQWLPFEWIFLLFFCIEGIGFGQKMLFVS